MIVHSGTRQLSLVLRCHDPSGQLPQRLPWLPGSMLKSEPKTGHTLFQLTLRQQQSSSGQAGKVCCITIVVNRTSSIPGTKKTGPTANNEQRTKARTHAHTRTHAYFQRERERERRERERRERERERRERERERRGERERERESYFAVSFGLDSRCCQLAVVEEGDELWQPHVIIHIRCKANAHQFTLNSTSAALAERMAWLHTKLPGC